MAQSQRSERARRRASRIRNQRITIIIIGLLLLALIGFLVFQSVGGPQPTAGPATINPSGLKIEELVIGEGAVAKAGDQVEVHYTGWLEDGKKFDSSVDRGKPFAFTLGQRAVIKGWDEGVAGMQVGGKRRLTIPPELAYGERGIQNVIPANATLIFEVELLAIK